jgi:hypothetical protein
MYPVIKPKNGRDRSTVLLNIDFYKFYTATYYLPGEYAMQQIACFPVALQRDKSSSSLSQQALVRICVRPAPEFTHSTAFNCGLLVTRAGCNGGCSSEAPDMGLAQIIQISAPNV